MKIGGIKPREPVVYVLVVECEGFAEMQPEINGEWGMPGFTYTCPCCGDVCLKIKVFYLRAQAPVPSLSRFLAKERKCSECGGTGSYVDTWWSTRHAYIDGNFIPLGPRVYERELRLAIQQHNSGMSQ